MKKYVSIILIFITLNSYTQDALFSQSDLNMLYTNPAYAGTDKGARVLIHRRDQWNNISTEKFHTNYIELNQFIKGNTQIGRNKHYGYGFHLISDMENSIFNLNQLGGSFSITFSNRRYLFAGAGQLNLLQYSANTNNLIFTDQINYYNDIIGPQNPDNLPLTIDQTNMSIGFGGLFSFLYGNKLKETTIAASLFNIGGVRSFNNTEDNKNPLRIHTHISHEFQIPKKRDDHWDKTISTFIKFMKQIEGFNNQIALTNRTEIGSTIAFIPPYKKHVFSAGAMFRKTITFDGHHQWESIIGIIRIRPSKNFVISYSYDGQLGTVPSGLTHEIGLMFILKKEPPRECESVNPLFER